MTSPRTLAAAKALCRQASIECNVDEADNWKTYSEMFIQDAMAAVAAADAAEAPSPPPLALLVLRTPACREATSPNDI